MSKSRVVLAGVVLLLVAGCSNSASHVGAAAVVGGQQISQQTVIEQLRETASQIQATSGQGPAPDGVILSQQIVNRLVLSELISQAVTDLKIDISDAKVTKFQESVYAQYGQKQVEQQLLTSQAIPASQVPGFFRLLLSEEAVSEKLAPGGTDNQRNQAFSKYMTRLAVTSNIEVSPRYGAWDSNQFKVTGVDNVLSSLVQSQ